MQEIVQQKSPFVKPVAFRKSLRNASINYRNGWFFVTSQVARNKSIFGAIVGEECVLNALGAKVRDYWLSLPEKYPELELDEFVVMPNHFHAIARIRYRPSNRENHLGFLMGRFKGGTGHIYGKMRREGLVEDIGEHLWQFDYWDDLVSSEDELNAMRRYIRANPAHWSRDRYGACTSYSFGNLALLNERKIAFVASQGYFAADLRMRRIWARAEARRSDSAGGSGADIAEGFSADSAGGACSGTRKGDGAADIGACGLSRRKSVVISTFTSAQEREALRRALSKGRCVIQVAPQGIPPEGEISPELLAACREGRALVISPQQPGSRLNKKVATWCNEYVIRHSDELWAGDISPNGMLNAMLGKFRSPEHV